MFGKTIISAGAALSAAVPPPANISSPFIGLMAMQELSWISAWMKGPQFPSFPCFVPVTYIQMEKTDSLRLHLGGYIPSFKSTKNQGALEVSLKMFISKNIWKWKNHIPLSFLLFGLAVIRIACSCVAQCSLQWQMVPQFVLLMNVIKRYAITLSSVIEFHRSIDTWLWSPFHLQTCYP